MAKEHFQQGQTSSLSAENQILRHLNRDWKAMTAMQKGIQETLRPLDLTALNGNESNFKSGAAAWHRAPAQKFSVRWMQRSSAWDESRLPIHKPNTPVTNEAFARKSSHFQNGSRQDISAMALSHSPFDQRQPQQTLRVIDHPAEHQNFARAFKTIHKLSGA